MSALRSSTRVLGRARAAGTAPLRRSMATKDTDDSLGGPGGQQPPPPKPAGPEAAKRNWVPMAAGALAVVGGYAYFSGPAKKPDLKTELKNMNKEDVANAVKQSASDSLKETSGKKGQLGGFRSE